MNETPLTDAFLNTSDANDTNKWLVHSRRIERLLSAVREQTLDAAAAACYLGYWTDARIECAAAVRKLKEKKHD